MSTRAHLWIAILILGSASAVVRKISELGALDAVAGMNPIQFCNVLFAGNLVAFIVLFGARRKEWTRTNVAAITGREWIALVAVSVLAVALAPALIFTALERTSVTSVVLLGRIEIPIVLALGALVLGESLSALSVAGAAIALGGVAASLLLAPMMDGFMFGSGEIYALLGAACLGAATILAKAELGAVPLGIFAAFRTLVGTVLFAVWVLIFFGPHHFADVLSPTLWRWMLLYGAVVVAGGQMLWYSGLRSTTTLQVTLASSLSPVIGVAAAYLVLGEVPMRAQFIGGAIILAGIALGILASLRKGEQPAGAPCMSTAEFDRGVGFKGI
ncbi:MAG: EamA family transporter [Acidobacteria bacterium]|nr:EamA family transporter [Acidobacteriota bacterium]